MAGNSATFLDGGTGGKIEVKDSIVNVMAGSYGTASGTIGARPEPKKEESRSTSGATGARPKQKLGEDCVKLSESIWFFKKMRLSKKALIFEGVQKSVCSDQQLAIKLIWHYTEKNKREAENLLKLRPHTHVVAIVRADVYKGAPEGDCLYIAMERCSTLNLEDYLKERSSKNVPFNPNKAFEHAKQVIDAIDHIHGYNIMHRDLKPSSVLFSLSKRVLKICDFGMSKELKHGHTVTGLSTLKVGTDGYRAPETYNENVISKRADIFSLALVLYHLLSYGFHPFGIDPEIWNFNIKNGKGLDLSRLRDPFLKIVKEMLEKMLNFEPKSRLKSDQVKNSNCMKLDWYSSIIESLVPIWNGVVKDDVDADILPCQLYRSASLQDDIGIDDSGWKFRMKTVPYLDIGSLKRVTDEEPSGYFETTKDELKKLTDKLTQNNLMGWINISIDGKDSKAIVLLFQRGYPELFGLLFPDTKILTSLIGNLASKQSLTPAETRRHLQKPAEPAATPQKPATGSGYRGRFGSFFPAKIWTSISRNRASKKKLTLQKPVADPAQSSNSPGERESQNLRAQSSELSSTSTERASVSTETINSGNVDQDPIKEQEAAPETNQWKETSSGLIPWWIFTGGLQK